MLHLFSQLVGNPILSYPIPFLSPPFTVSYRKEDNLSLGYLSFSSSSRLVGYHIP